MAKENIRGTASLSQNEVNVKSFFEEIFGNAEAQSSPFVNPKSAKTFQPSNAQIEADVKDFFEFVSELNDVNDCFGELIDEACEAYFTDFVKPILDKKLCLTKKQTDALIKHLVNGDNFKKYLSTMSKFHNYSFNNTMLIAMQKPDASLVAGFNTWKNKFERNVNRGEKGIQIFAPSPYTIKKEQTKLDEVTQLPVLDKDGKPVTEEVDVKIPSFKVVSVFDVSQTNGKELPTLGADELAGNVEDFEKFFAALKEVSPVPIGFEQIDSGAKGYFNREEHRIAINEGMSEVQTIKTAVHEIAHSKLHDRDLKKSDVEQMQSRKRLTATGTIKWSAANIGKILKNVTYKGCIGYFKSYSNNYLEQKRIINHDNDTYECVKGNFEPIISEEQWDRCQAIMESKKRVTVVQNGEAQKECHRSSSSMWVKKLRCSCGSSFRKNRYHKDKDGNVTYNFVCYNQVNYGKASTKAKLGLDTEGYCDEAPITEWKLDLMAKYFLDEAWKSKADDLMTALSYIQKYYLSATKNNTQKSQAVTDLQIDKVEKRIKSLITMFADGSVTKDEFDTMKADYNAELAKLKEQKFTTDEQQEIVENCMFDMASVSKALYEMVNAQNAELSNDLLDEMVSSITVENRRYVWHYRYAPQKKSNATIEVEGKKKTPVIRIDGIPANAEKEASDEASDIHKIEKSIISEYGEKKLSLIQTLHRLQSQTSNLKF